MTEPVDRTYRNVEFVSDVQNISKMKQDMKEM